MVCFHASTGVATTIIADDLLAFDLTASSSCTL